MSNFITIELCADDRARIDKLIQALEQNTAQKVTAPSQNPQSTTQVQTDPAQVTLAEVISNEEETPTSAITPNEDEKPTNQEKETVGKAELKALVIKLCANGKKAESRNIILKYAPTVASVPEDKIAECYDKLVALGG